MQKTLSKLLANQTVVIDNHKQAGESGWVWDESVHLHKRLKDKKRQRASVIVHLNKVEIKYTPNNISAENRTFLQTELESVFKEPEIRAKFIAELCAFWAEITKASYPITEDNIDSIDGAITNIARAFGINSKIKKKMVEDSVAFFKFANHQIIAVDASKGARLSIGSNKMLIKQFVKQRSRRRNQCDYELLNIKEKL